MTYLLHIVVALATLPLPWLLGIDPEPRSIPLVLASVAVLPYVLARAVLLLSRSRRYRAAAFLDRLLGVVPLVAQAAAVVLCGWASAIDFGGEDQWATWPGLELVVGIAPFLASMVGAIDARARLHASSPVGVRRARSFQLRMLASAVLPFVFYLGVSALVGSNEVWRVHLEQVGLLSAAFTLFLLALFVLVLPRMLTSTWDTVPIPDSGLRTYLRGLADLAGFRCRELLVWRTNGQMSNAAIVGFTPRTRVVLFSDVLLESLDPLEIGAVFGHEMGHARRRHAMVFGAHAVSFLLAADLLSSAFGAGESTSSIVTGVALIAWFLSFGYLSRRVELEADLESRDLLGGSEHIMRALQTVTGAHAYRRTSWRHFSTEERVRFLARVDAQPELAVRLRARLRRWSRVIFVAFGLVIAAQLVTYARAWNEDRVYVDMRLGRYDDAAERVASIDAFDDESVERLISLGVSLGADERAPEALETRALELWNAGEVERAADRLRLSLWRGRSLASDVLDAIDGRVRGEPLIDVEERLPRAWQEALEREGVFDRVRRDA